MTAFNGQAVLEVKGGGSAQSWFRLPWAGCGGAYEWQIHLNPAVSTELKAHTNGGNVSLNLAGMSLTRLAVDTAGGNMDVALPDQAANLSATVKSGGGNVTVEVGSSITGSNTIDAGSGGGNVEVRVPSGVAVKVHASTGMGKVIVDPRLSKTGANTYQSPDFDGAADKVEITAGSGAGNVIVKAK